MILAAFGIKKSERTLAKEMKTKKRSGTRIFAFQELARRYGLRYVTKTNASLKDLKKHLRRGYKIIVGHRYPLDRRRGHFSVIQKIDKRGVALLDPEFGPRTKHPMEEFLSLWRKGLPENKKPWFIGFSK